MAWYDDINYDDLGTVLGKMAGARGSGRLAQAGAQQNQDRVGLDAARLNLQAPGMRAGAAMQGDILSGLQPVSVSGPLVHTGGKMPTVSGGLSPSLLSPNTRQLGKTMNRDALLSQMSGPAYTPTPMPKSNGLDSLMNAGAAGAGILGALKGGGGNGAGGEINLSELFGSLFGQKNALGGKATTSGNFDPSAFADIDPSTGMPFASLNSGNLDPSGIGGRTDPSQFGPHDDGLSAFYDWLDQQNGGSGQDRGSAIAQPDEWGF